MHQKKTGLKKEFAKYAALNVMGMLGLSCYILADTYFVSNRLGADGLTALNIAISIYSFINGAGLMIGIGGATRYTICKSRKEDNAADRAFSSAVILGLTVGILFTVAGILTAYPLAGFLGAAGKIQVMTSTYLKILMCFSPFFILNNIMIAFIRNDGAPRLSMGAMLIGSLSNIVLDYLFMYPLGMGMAGAALATGAAPVIGLGLCALHFLKKHNQFHFRKSRIQAKECVEMCALGIAAFINEISSGIVLVVFNLLILGIAGNTGVAAYGIVANLALVALAVFTGIAQGSQPLVSRYYGKGQRKELKQVLGYSAVTAGITGAAIFAVVFLLASPLAAVFNSEQNQALQQMAELGLKLYFIGFLPAGINIIIAAYLGATENPKASFIISIIRGCIGITVLAAVFGRIWKMTGIWLAFPVCEALTLLLAVKMWRNGIEQTK